MKAIYSVKNCRVICRRSGEEERKLFIAQHFGISLISAEFLDHFQMQFHFLFQLVLWFTSPLVRFFCHYNNPFVEKSSVNEFQMTTIRFVKVANIFWVFCGLILLHFTRCALFACFLSSFHKQNFHNSPSFVLHKNHFSGSNPLDLLLH